MIEKAKYDEHSRQSVGTKDFSLLKYRFLYEKKLFIKSELEIKLKPVFMLSIYIIILCLLCEEQEWIYLQFYLFILSSRISFYSVAKI